MNFIPSSVYQQLPGFPLCASALRHQKNPLHVSCEKKLLVRPQKLHFMLMQHISDNSGFWQHKPAPVHAQFWSGQNTTELGMGNSRDPSNDGNTRGLSPCTKYKGLTFLSHCTHLLRNCEKSKESRDPNELMGATSAW